MSHAAVHPRIEVSPLVQSNQSKKWPKKEKIEGKLEMVLIASFWV
jgi:hypothetical protein